MTPEQTPDGAALMACPFCGAEPVGDESAWGGNKAFSLACFRNGHEVEVSGSTPGEAIAAWNRRTTLATEQKPVAALMREGAAKDIAQRNAGHECITIWKSGGFVHHGYRDAEVATLCEPDDVLLTIRIDTLEAVNFITPQQRIDLAVKLFLPPTARVNTRATPATEPTPAPDAVAATREACAKAIAKVLGIDLDEQCPGFDGEGCDSPTCPGALTEDHDAEEHRERIYRMADAAIRALPLPATEPASDAGEVTQADRIAACEILHKWPGTPCAEVALVRAFAAHRIAALVHPSPAQSDEPVSEAYKLREALNLAANRLARCALDHELFTEKYYEVAEWGEEARAALNPAPRGEEA